MQFSLQFESPKLSFFVVYAKTKLSIMNKPTGTPMTQADAARIQAAQASQNGGQVAKGSFAARAQSSADKAAATQGKSGR